MRGLGAGLLALLLVGCGALDNVGVEWEHKLRVNTDCPDVEVIGRSVIYQLRSGGTLTCDHVRIVSGPPYRNATYLECQAPMYAEPPSERRR